MYNAWLGYGVYVVGLELPNHIPCKKKMTISVAMYTSHNPQQTGL